ncbi:MAG TPA: hypothetical protein VML94_03725 [Thermoplasmata archaeon]|nr:hypothetical protein [Thermoplasmata archaeon]
MTVARVTLIVAVVALVLAAAALGVSWANSGSSPSGPGIVIAHASLDSGGGRVPHVGHCENVTGLVLHLGVSGPGTVLVEANVQATLYHSSDEYAAAAFFVSNASATCPGSPVLTYIDDGIATGTYIQDVSVVGSFSVTAAATDSFYLTGYDYSTGTDYTLCGFVNMVAVFIPS